MARSVPLPETHLYRNVEISALRYPDKPYIIFYDTPISFSRFQHESERIVGFLQKECGVRKGDRVLLYMQNSPQFVLAYYGILRADAVVVPVNPMSLTDELAHYVADSGARVAFTAQDIYQRMRPHLGCGLDHIIVGTYSDCLEQATDLAVPDFVAAPRHAYDDAGAIAWRDVLASGHEPDPITSGRDIHAAHVPCHRHAGRHESAAVYRRHPHRTAASRSKPCSTSIRPSAKQTSSPGPATT